MEGHTAIRPARVLAEPRDRPAPAGFLPMPCSPRCHREHSPHTNAEALTRSPRPHGPIDHTCTHASGYGICFDDAFDGRSAVCRVGAGERAGRPQRCFASGGPEREVCHARQRVEVNTTHRPQAMHHRVEQGAQDAGPRDFELALSGRRCASPMGARVRKIARSPRSGRLTTSSIPFKRIGRAG
jgi:hypothetical protein